MANRRNFYRLLHVQPDAPVQVIKSSYRALMLSLEMHPDRGGDQWNAALLNEAYAVLSDPDRRREYDRERGFSFERSDAPKQAPRRPSRERTRTTCVFCGTPESPEAVMCATCRSPLCPPKPLHGGGSGQRLESRISHDRKLVYYTDWPQSAGFRGEARDLSPSGLRFVATRDLERYRILKIDAGPFQATARVVHCRQDGSDRTYPYVVGVEFFTFFMQPVSGSLLSTRA